MKSIHLILLQHARTEQLFKYSTMMAYSVFKVFRTFQTTMKLKIILTYMYHYRRLVFIKYHFKMNHIKLCYKMKIQRFCYVSNVTVILLLALVKILNSVIICCLVGGMLLHASGMQKNYYSYFL